MGPLQAVFLFDDFGVGGKQALVRLIDLLVWGTVWLWWGPTVRWGPGLRLLLPNRSSLASGQILDSA